MISENIHLGELADDILKELTDKQKDIILKRFAIGYKEPLTLQKIGDEYEITRERVRQIQNEALIKLKASKRAKKRLEPIIKDLHRFLEEHGGLKHEEKLVRNFINIYKKLKKEEKENFLGFLHLVLNLSHPHFSKHKETQEIHPHWYNNNSAPKKAKKLIKNLIEEFQKIKTPLHKNELIGLVKNYYFDLNEKAIISYIEISKKISANIFNFWGLSDWEEIKQRGVKGKIYTTLEVVGKPMHFEEIADFINKHYNKKIKIATVHNELIKDKRFVLAGRGIYALKKWGYEDEPVKDVILKILKKNKGRMNYQDLIKKVLSKKLVKPETVKLNIKLSKNVKREGDDVILLNK